MEYSVFRLADLPSIDGVPMWEGRQLVDGAISLLFVDLPPGEGPRLHVHSYEEIFLLHEGQARFTIGCSTRDIVAGELVAVRAGIPHKFENSGSGRLLQTNIHLNPAIVTTWLEEP